MKKNILITGGTGYIGSHGVVAFENAGYNTVIIDNLSNSSLETLDGIEKIIGKKPDFYNIDINDKNGLENIFSKYKFDGVLHFAGLKAVGESCEKPFDYYKNNVVGSLTLFEVMKDFGVKNIIFSSSATVYKPKLGLLETDEVGDCSNPYGTTKFLLENILKDLSVYSGFNVINLRYFNPIGAHESGYIGENPKGIPNNLLPFIMKVAVGELSYVNVFGDDYDTIDGTGVRDYIDVCDLIDGHLKAYEFLQKNISSEKGFFEVFNLGTGKGLSVLEMINFTQKAIGIDIKYQIKPRRPGDLATVYCIPDKALKLLGWQASISPQESIKKSFKYIKSFT